MPGEREVVGTRESPRELAASEISEIESDYVCARWKFRKEKHEKRVRSSRRRYLADRAAISGDMPAFKRKPGASCRISMFAAVTQRRTIKVT
jgi:hypothetical protein